MRELSRQDGSQREPVAAAAPLRLAPSPAPAAALLGVQRAAGNRAARRWLGSGGARLARQGDAVAEQIAKGDWHGAAWAAGQLDPSAMEARIRALSSDQRQYLTEGARHGEGSWDAAKVIDTVDRVDHRDAVIGSVRFFVWKHLWQRAGEFMCGLNDPDIRRVATRLGLTWDDLRAIADSQPEQAQRERLNVAFFTDLAFTAKIPKDLVGEKEAGRSVIAWLAKDELVAPFAAAKWGGGAGPTAHVVPAEKWQDFYAGRAKGRVDPATGEALTEEAARRRAVTSHGFTTDTDEIYLKGGENSPGALLHEAIHALAPDAFDDQYGRLVDEGTTEYFARRVAAKAGKHPPSAYKVEHAGVQALAALVGDALLAEAFFTGKTLRLQSAVDDARGAGTFSAWRRAMQEPEERNPNKAADALKGAPAAVP